MLRNYNKESVNLFSGSRLIMKDYDEIQETSIISAASRGPGVILVGVLQN